MKKLYLALVNAVLVVIFGVILSWIAVFTLCSGNNSLWCRYDEKYAIAGGIAAFCVLLYLFSAQLEKTIGFFSKKRRPSFLSSPIRFNFESVLSLLDDNQEKEEVRKDLKTVGWLAKFEDGNDLFVSVNDISNFLLLVCRNQIDIDYRRKTGVVSPVGQRLHVNIGRRKLNAFKGILRVGGVLVPHNGNIERVKHANAWLLVEELRKTYPETDISDFQ